MSGNFRPFKEEASSYRNTGIPCGNHNRYSTGGVIRMPGSAPRVRRGVPQLPEAIETEADRQIKELVAKQLNTKVTLNDQLTRHRDFTTGAIFKAPLEDFQGAATYSEYSRLLEDGKRSDDLRQFGLTDDEIALKIAHDAKIPTDNTVSSATKRRYGADPVAHTSRIDAVNEKISERQLQLSLPTHFAGRKAMSRHELDLERAVSHDEQRTKLTECLLTAKQKSSSTIDDPNDPINHLDEIVSGIMAKAPDGKRRKRKKRCEKESFSDDNLRMELAASSELIDGKKTTEELFVAAPTCAERPVALAATNEALISADESGLSKLPDDKTLMIRSLECRVEPIPVEVIERYRLSVEQIRELPRFKDYCPGEASKTLYLKNLSPHVTEEDLVSLFVRFQQPDDPKIVFKLLSGRMKGQAFVTFNDIATATTALQLVNGYDFKGKPIIIQYGKKSETTPPVIRT